MKASAVLACVAALYAATSPSDAAEAPSRDEIARVFVAREAEWAEQACTHRIVETDLLWDDFVGTNTRGGWYSKQQSIEDSRANKTPAHDCRLLETQVHFFSDDVAVVIGSETVVLLRAPGREERECLFWTDTWIRRAGQWRIAAAQDARLPCPEGTAPRKAR